MTEFDPKKFAREWIAGWNAHDLDAILSHYSEDVVLTSPIAASLLDDPSGTVRGKAALRMYFKRGLEAYPNLRFDLLDVMHGLSSVVLCYVNQRGTKSAEFMEFGAPAQSKTKAEVVRVVANYSE
jgi:hypothetical protein